MKQLTQKQIEAIFTLSPFELDTTTNHLDQTVRFLEHPTQGDAYPVLIHITSDGVHYVCVSDFFETYDMKEIEDYMPLLIDGKIVLYFEVEEQIMVGMKKKGS